jgi:hypothetical protein
LAAECACDEEHIAPSLLSANSRHKRTSAQLEMY